MARNKLAGKGKNKRKGSNESTGRDYSYDKRYESSPEQKKKRAARNAARRRLIRSRGRSKLKGKDIHHKNGNPLDNRSQNLTAISKSKNRSKK